MRSSEGFVFVRPGLHLYYHVLGDGPETVRRPQRQLAGGAAAAARRGAAPDPLRPAEPRAVERRHRRPAPEPGGGRRRPGGGAALLRPGEGVAARHLLPRRDHRHSTRWRTRSGWSGCCSSARSRRGGRGSGCRSCRAPRSSPSRRASRGSTRCGARGSTRSDPVAFCRAWFTYFLLPAQMGELAAAARFPLDDVSSFPNEWPQHAMSVYFSHIIPKMEGWDFRPRLAELRAPLLVMQGTDDLVPIEASREWAAHAADGALPRHRGRGLAPLHRAPARSSSRPPTPSCAAAGRGAPRSCRARSRESGSDAAYSVAMPRNWAILPRIHVVVPQSWTNMRHRWPGMPRSCPRVAHRHAVAGHSWATARTYLSNCAAQLPDYGA